MKLKDSKGILTRFSLLLIGLYFEVVNRAEVFHQVTNELSRYPDAASEKNETKGDISELSEKDKPHSIVLV